MLLISIYWVISVFLIFVGTLAAQSLADVRGAQRSQAGTQAWYFAEAGIDQAIVQLRANANWAGGNGALAGGTYNVAVQNLGNDRYRISSQGSTDLAGGTVPRNLEAIVRVTPVGVPPGFFADESVDVVGSVRVDSYDSRRGFRPTSRGRIGTNSTANRAIEVNGSVDVFGDVLAGPGAPPEAIEIIGSSRVSGEIGASDEVYPMAPVNEPVGNEDLRLSGNRRERLPGGVYHFRTFSVTGGASLEFTEPATVYVENLDLSGTALITRGHLPPNLKINVVGNAPVRLSGTSLLTAQIYAPESEVVLTGDNEFYGGLAGRTLRLNGSLRMWYDEALLDGGGGGGNQVRVLSWTEPGA